MSEDSTMRRSIAIFAVLLVAAGGRMVSLREAGAR
jgi:hypothetical protein